jgi:hypothetical protein
VQCRQTRVWYNAPTPAFFNTSYRPGGHLINAELAHILGVTPDEARDLQREAAQGGVGCWFVQDTDYIESWAPFYNAPTLYRVTVRGEQKWYGQ